jgi:tripartite-type tricarboxylate transporter receptor subunit TctC
VLAVLAGEAHMTWSSIPTILPHVRAGKARALGIGNAERIPSLKEFPTIAESGVPGFESFAWGGLIGPANMPKDIVARLNKEVLAVLGQKDVIDRMLADGTVPSTSSPEDFLAYERSELKKWGEVVKLAGIRPE